MPAQGRADDLHSYRTSFCAYTAIILFYNSLMQNKEWDVVHAQQQQEVKWLAVKVTEGAAPEAVTG